MCWASARGSEPAANADRAAARSSSRRETESPSNIALPQFFRQILGRAPRQSGDRERRILVGIADKRRGIGDKQILHFVRLAVFVERGSTRIVPHPHGAKFVDDLTPNADAIAFHRLGFGPGYGSPHGFQYGGKGLMHVLGLLQLVIGPFEVEAQNRNTELVDYGRVDLAISIRVRDMLTASSQ